MINTTMKWIAFACTVLLVFTSATASTTTHSSLGKAPIHPSDMHSLQRGAKYYVNYCAGCHSLKYVRFSRIARDLDMDDRYDRVLTQTVKENLVFDEALNIGDTLTIAMNPEDAERWFGVKPPDLSLVARVRGVDWLYQYLRGFYRDADRPWGVNNLMFKDVAMPNVLEHLQGVQIPVYKRVDLKVEGARQSIKAIDKLEIAKPGTLEPAEFNSLVADLVNFLDYVGEPVRHKRVRLGFWVIGFMLLLCGSTYLLKQEYWRDVHK